MDYDWLIKKASLLNKFSNAETTKISSGLTEGAAGNMPHSGTRVKLEKNSVFVNCCATIQKLQLLTPFENLQEVLLVITYRKFLTYSDRQYDFCMFRLYTVISPHLKNIKNQ